ncbi:glycoside hydrolase family 127 protein [Actinomyces radicidentis]|uniref:glycoside hydrolase family 127 protein n=1 Tax=Actinomyces radicidentis TaxID=111015 RepID=UPI0026DECC2B|nr:beta-L-arabinofuranosidase domain-containing protein [Actinomyces radicidentis]
MTELPAPSIPSRGVLRPLAVRAVLLGGALGERVARSSERTLPHCVEHLETSGVMDNLRSLLDEDGHLRALAELPPHRGFQFADSDLFKVLEAIGWERARTGTTRWDGWLEEVLALLGRVQETNGYLNSWGQRHEPAERLRDMTWSHELYCAGHLIQAGIALSRSGYDALLEIARREADLIVRELGPTSGARRTDGHPEIETALVELTRETGDRSYLDTALHLLGVRGEGTLSGDRMGPYYFQDHLPVREAPTATGHAVRQLYLDAGCVDAAVESGDAELLSAAVRRWEDAHARRTAITGAMGSRHADESFGDAYELPPDRTYGETCAAIADLQLSWRLLLETGESRYARVIERLVHNILDAAVGLDGTSFFYSNPLQLRGDHRDEEGAPTHRLPWYSCACCLPNLARLHASLPAYAAAEDSEGIRVVLLGNAGIRLSSGGRLDIETGYPLDGRVRLRVPAVPEGLTIRLCAPEWAAEQTLCAHVALADGDTRDLRVAAQDGWWPVRVDGECVVTLDVPVGIRVLEADGRADALRGCVAVMRGPVVYCAEGVDQAEGLASLDGLAIDPASVRETRDVLGGLPVLEAIGSALLPADGVEDTPYRPWTAAGQHDRRAEGRVRLVPYGYWGNRGESPMRVWMVEA